MTNAGHLVLLFLLLPYAVLGFAWGWALAEPGPLTDFSLVKPLAVLGLCWAPSVPVAWRLRRRGAGVQLDDESPVRALPASLVMLWSWAAPFSMGLLFVLALMVHAFPRLAALLQR